MKISIVIPSLNEQDFIGHTLHHLLRLPGNYEVLVVDGGSKDQTREIVKSFSGVTLARSIKGRGAHMASGDILLFLHADTLLPPDFYRLVIGRLNHLGHIGGSFRLNLDKKHPLLLLYSWCSRFSWAIFTYGDHALFMKKNIFHAIGGYCSMPFMEDVEIQGRLRKAGKFRKLPAWVTTSARRFEATGTLPQLAMDLLLVGFYKLGVSPSRLKRFYKDHS